ncbi:uncharacterized protein DNG_01334 [Cephalotrichum gorgonifer]|uniref:HMG box domain-containing protein n=1 Tax=Cephalotrichum gorgonifer TaxID=2041049 RepID=A0AAE8MQC7_9PEZI|nr:uncharacterized protein DNG_01334 [Cephalotrichum gorgonifer]
MDGHLEPRSPAPSPGELGLHHLIGHDAPSASFSGLGGTTTGKLAGAGAGPQSQNHQGNPTTHYSMADMGSNNTPVYSLRSQGVHPLDTMPRVDGLVAGTDGGKTHHGNGLSFDPTVVPYGPPPGGHGYPDPRLYGTPDPIQNPRPYGTPDESPRVARTRSSTRLSSTRPANTRPRASESKLTRTKSGRIQKSAPAPKKKKTQKKPNPNRPMTVAKPLSEASRENPDIEVHDIASYVQRPREVRLKEVKKGNIKRPMNSFMLYRKTYQLVAKKVSDQNNHQVISVVCGDAWAMEPAAVREQFDQWAAIERANHGKAYPNYKFKPKTKKKDVQPEEEFEDEDGDLDAEEDPQHAQTAPPMSVYASYQAYGSGNAGLSPPPPYQAYPNQGRHMSPPYDNPGITGGQYYQQSVYSAPGGGPEVEDVIIRRVPSPAAYEQQPGGPMLQEYHGLPSQYPPITQHLGQEQAVDPSLVSRTDVAQYHTFYDGFGLEMDTQWQAPPRQDSPPELQDSMAPIDAVLSQDPQIGYLRGDGDGWQVEELGGQNSQFDTWPA